MRKWVLVAGAALLFPIIGVGAPQQEKTPDLSWAYPVPSANAAARPAGNQPSSQVLAVPGSTKTYTAAQLEDQFDPPDWFPNEHPPMPDVVAHGHRGTNIRACDLCHLPNGQGHPESANLAGMPAAYLERQIDAWKRGERRNGGGMTVIAKALSDADARAAAEYFASLKPTNWVTVEETDTVPQTYVNNIFMRLRRPTTGAGGGTEPLGNRIIELPVDETRTANRDPHSGTIAYVPKGSVAKGEALVQTGEGRTIPCGTCHGDALTGLAEVPRLANLSPLYIARQLYNFQGGVTPGTWSELMRKPVAQLSDEDIVDVAAYLASLPASGASVTPEGGNDVGSNGGGNGNGEIPLDRLGAGSRFARNDNAGNGASEGNASAASASASAPANAPAGENNSAGSGAPSAALVAQGKDLYLKKYKCSDCHGLHGEGSDDAPDLVGTRLNADEIAMFLINPDSDARTKGMPNFDPKSPEIAPLVAFVLSMKKSQ